MAPELGVDERCVIEGSSRQERGRTRVSRHLTSAPGCAAGCRVGTREPDRPSKSHALLVPCRPALLQSRAASATMVSTSAHQPPSEPDRAAYGATDWCCIPCRTLSCSLSLSVALQERARGQTSPRRQPTKRCVLLHTTRRSTTTPAVSLTRAGC
jgi:hypothetical protein